MYILFKGLFLTEFFFQSSSATDKNVIWKKGDEIFLNIEYGCGNGQICKSETCNDVASATGWFAYCIYELNLL